MKAIKLFIRKNLLKKCREYSWTFHKMGLFIKHDGQWYFCPDDGSFVCGKPNDLIEWSRHNPLFYSARYERLK